MHSLPSCGWYDRVSFSLLLNQVNVITIRRATGTTRTRTFFLVIISLTSCESPQLSDPFSLLFVKQTIDRLHVTSLPPCWRTITKYSSLGSIVLKIVRPMLPWTFEPRAVSVLSVVFSFILGYWTSVEASLAIGLKDDLLAHTILFWIRAWYFEFTRRSAKHYWWFANNPQRIKWQRRGGHVGWTNNRS